MLHLMYQFIYLSEEDTKLQYIGGKLGANFDTTPKCHPELAGEGIEYLLGRTKSLYHMMKLKDKRGKAIFLKIVRHCISQV